MKARASCAASQLNGWNCGYLKGFERCLSHERSTDSVHLLLYLASQVCRRGSVASTLSPDAPASSMSSILVAMHSLTLISNQSIVNLEQPYGLIIA